MKVFLAFVFLIIPFSSIAGTAGLGSLNDIYFMSSGAAIIYTTGVRSGSPSCATVTGRFAIDAATAAGKAQLAGMLLAFSSGKSVEIFGSGACNVWPDTETVNYFHVLP